MANGINKVILVGNLGKDPEVRHFENGSSVASFSLATTETYTDREGNKQSQTEWHNVNLWRGLATVAERYLRKGSKVYIEGRLRTRSYEKDGVTRYVTEIEGREMVMLDSREGGSNQGGGYMPPSAQDEPTRAAASQQSPMSAPASAGTASTEQPSLDNPEEADDLPF